MPNPPQRRQVLQRVTPGSNGRDMGVTPQIAHMVEFLDRAIRTQDPTIGTVVAAVGILLGKRGMDPDNLEKLIYDMTSAMRVGYYLSQSQKEK